MDADARGRFCRRCAKAVHDISAMTEEEAQAFVRERAGTQVCVRYRKDAEQRIRFRAASAVVAAVALAACTPHAPPQHTESHDPPEIEVPAVIVIPTDRPIDVAPPPMQAPTVPAKGSREPEVAKPGSPEGPPPRRKKIELDDTLIGLVGL